MESTDCLLPRCLLPPLSSSGWACPRPGLDASFATQACEQTPAKSESRGCPPGAEPSGGQTGELRGAGSVQWCIPAPAWDLLPVRPSAFPVSSLTAMTPFSPLSPSSAFFFLSFQNNVLNTFSFNQGSPRVAVSVRPRCAASRGASPGRMRARQHRRLAGLAANP